MSAGEKVGPQALEGALLVGQDQDGLSTIYAEAVWTSSATFQRMH